MPSLFCSFTRLLPIPLYVSFLFYSAGKAGYPLLVLLLCMGRGAIVYPLYESLVPDTGHRYKSSHNADDYGNTMLAMCPRICLSNREASKLFAHF